MEKQLSIVKQVQDIIKGTPFETKLVISLNKNPDLDKFTGETAPDLRIKREFLTKCLLNRNNINS